MSIPESLLQIAVVEDNDTLRHLLVGYLQRPGRLVHAAESGLQLNALIAQHSLHIVVLDLGLPDESGFSIAERIRSSNPEIKIVMLTASMRLSDIDRAYSKGVDVYLFKPTNFNQLESVIANLASALTIELAKDYCLNRQLNLMTSPEQKQSVLTPVEASIVEQLTLAPKQTIEPEALLAQLRRVGTADFSREDLVVSISRLRKKMESAFNGDALIKIDRKKGYCLETTVRMC